MEQYYIVRSDRAGVFFGKIEPRYENENMLKMVDVRKIYYWSGACAVEELAVNGVKRPNDCKFTVVVPEMVIADPIQVIPCTPEATAILSEVPVWKF